MEDKHNTHLQGSCRRVQWWGKLGGKARGDVRQQQLYLLNLKFFPFILSSFCRKCFLHRSPSVKDTESFSLLKWILCSRSCSSFLSWVLLSLTAPALTPSSFVCAPTCCLCLRIFRVLCHSLSNSSAPACLATQKPLLCSCPSNLCDRGVGLTLVTGS